MPRKSSLLHFVRGIVAGATGEVSGRQYVTSDGRSAPVRDVKKLIEAGAMDGDGRSCRANALTTGWLKRAMLDADAFQAQHRQMAKSATGQIVNLRESPLSRLVTGEAAFLEIYHVEAGERVRQLVERAQLRPRVTMNYTGVTDGGGRTNKTPDLSDLAVDARRRIADIHRALPTECAGVVLDVCGWLKGLQEVESERGWPRRSAKLVLRIGLDQLAHLYRLGPYAGGRGGRSRNWLAEGRRPSMKG